MNVLLMVFFGSSKAQNNALNFDGINDNVKLAFNPAMDFASNNSFSVEMWFKTTLSTTELISNIINDVPAKGIVMGLTGGKPYFYIGNTVYSNWMYITGTTLYNDGNWHHLAYTYNGSVNASGMKIYVDGILQTVIVNGNALTSPSNSGASFNIGSRNSINYFYNGSIDEVRFWNKELCASEINGRKNCELLGNEPQLLAYYKFNQGIAGALNTGITSLTDVVASTTGTLTGFSLNGTTSNWVAATPSISGTCNYNYVTVTGNTNICNGGSTTLTASGATTYSWNFGSTSPSVVVNPSSTTTYSLYSNNTFSCSGITTVTVNVNAGLSPTISVMASNSVICLGGSSNLSCAGANTYTWSNSNNGSFIVVSPTTTTSYTVIGTNTISGCTGTNTLSVNVNSLPLVTINSSSTTICIGQSVNLIANGASTYIWSTSSTATSISVSPIINTTYSVTGTDTLTGCTNSSSVTINVHDCTVGLFNNTLDIEQIILYPNPSNGIVSIKSSRDIELTIIDELGRKIIDVSLNEMNNRVQSVNNLAEGIYFITSSSENTFKNQKLIIIN
ncbi:MAG: LamG-like jellyroll fold domain-containing protein [Bacteroidota bacterium]|nr:LamG-like jellyroll fold domain-containing protein [Bacteroidota bacterium]